jgi:endonuclease-3
MSKLKSLNRAEPSASQLPPKIPRPVTEVERRRQAVKAIKILEKRWPDAKCELYYRTHYQLLVSVVLSAQTTDKMVNACMQPVYDAGFEPATVIALGIPGLLEKIKRVGLAPTKAKNVYNLTKILLEEHGGKVPKTRDKLEALPGVGRKTANVILGELFGQPTLAVDTHVFRVTKRLGLHDENDPVKAEHVLTKIVPPSSLPKAHHLFIFHGRYLCKAQRPDCLNCPAAKICPSFMTTGKEI